MSAPLPAGIGVARGALGGHGPQKVLEHIVICALRGGIKQFSVVRLKSNILVLTKFFGRPNFWTGYAIACRGKLPNLRADRFTVGEFRVIITCRAGPSRCGAQCKIWAWGLMQDIDAGPL